MDKVSIVGEAVSTHKTEAESFVKNEISALAKTLTHAEAILAHKLDPNRKSVLDARQAVADAKGAIDAYDIEGRLAWYLRNR